MVSLGIHQDKAVSSFREGMLALFGLFEKEINDKDSIHLAGQYQKSITKVSLRFNSFQTGSSSFIDAQSTNSGESVIEICYSISDGPQQIAFSENFDMYSTGTFCVKIYLYGTSALPGLIGGGSVSSGGGSSGGGSSGSGGSSTTYQCPPSEWWCETGEYRVINGIVYTSISYPGIEQGLPWAWWEVGGYSTTSDLPLIFALVDLLQLNLNQSLFLLGRPDVATDINLYTENFSNQNIIDKINASKEHIDGLMSNDLYASFVESYETNDLSGKMWWENDTWLDQNFSFSADCPLGWCNLTQAEKAFILTYPLAAFMIKINSDVAKNETRQMFNIAPQDAMPPNDKANAFLHAFWCAMNLYSIGEIKARLFAAAHESETPQQLQLETTMDFFNNEVGYNIAKTHSSLFSSHVYQALQIGQLRYLKPINNSDPYFWGGSSNGVPVPETHGISPNITQLVPTNQ